MAKSKSTKLTDTAIRKLQRGKKLADPHYPGLNVSKSASGKTAFFYRYRSPVPKSRDDGEDYYPMKQVKLGIFPEMSLAAARAEHEKLRARRNSGFCPASEKKAEKEAAAAEISRKKAIKKQEVFTVEACIEKYLTEHIEPKLGAGGVVIRKGARKAKGAAEVRRILTNDPAKVLGSVPVIDVTSEMVVGLIMKVVNRGSNVVAGSVLRELMAAFDYAIGTELPSDYQNPCYQAKGILRRKRVRLTSEKGKRTLNDGELSALLKWLPGSRYTQTQKNILLFTLMTGCRTGEVCNALWNDVDLEAGTWHLRETKTGAERYVQLSRQAIDFLEQLTKVTGKYPFPSQKTGLPLQQKQLTEQAWRMRRDGTFIDLPKWTPHDLRRTVRTGLARMGCPSAVGETVLGHALSGNEGTYNLCRYEKECREWLQKWCDHLDVLTASEKVMSIGGGHG